MASKLLNAKTEEPIYIYIYVIVIVLKCICAYSQGYTLEHHKSGSDELNQKKKRSHSISHEVRN